jgi:hypothetical protein
MRIKIANFKGEIINWKERLGVIEIDAQCSEDGWIDEWLEASDLGEGVVTVNRAFTPPPAFRRHDASAKRASTSNWDSEFSAAQDHVKDILSKLGNTR